MNKNLTWAPGVALVALLAAACGFPSQGPELVVEIFTPTGRSISSGSVVGAAEMTVPTNLNRDRDACCCAVAGSATNRGTVTVGVKLSFDALHPSDDDPVGKAIQFIERMEPGETRELDARGFLLPCNDVESVALTEVDLRAFVFNAPD